MIMVMMMKVIKIIDIINNRLRITYLLKDKTSFLNARSRYADVVVVH